MIINKLDKEIFLFNIQKRLYIFYLYLLLILFVSKKFWKNLNNQLKFSLQHSLLLKLLLLKLLLL